MKRRLVRANVLVLALHYLLSVTPAGAEPLTPLSRGSEQSVVNAEAIMTSLGSLHMSEGKVVVQQNQIVVLSNPTDSVSNAELTGTIIAAHEANEDGGRTLRGIAIFTGGFSLPALDDFKVSESIKASDGIERTGRIVDVTPTILRIQTADGIKIIPTKYITQVTSMRAFQFSLPVTVSTKQVGSLLLPAAPAGTNAAAPSSFAPSSFAPSVVPTPQAATTKFAMISFVPTYVVDPYNPPARRSQTYQAQLTQRHPGKRARTLAVIGAAMAACVAVPAGVAAACPRPH